MIKILNRKTGEFVTDDEELMKLAGLESYHRFEDIGVQGDGTPVVFDRCGNFGYLDPGAYRAVFLIDAT